MPVALAGAAQKRGAEIKMLVLPKKSVPVSSLQVGQKVVAVIPTTSRLIKKSRKIVKILAIQHHAIYSSLGLDPAPPVTFVLTKKYGLIPASVITRIL